MTSQTLELQRAKQSTFADIEMRGAVFPLPFGTAIQGLQHNTSSAEIGSCSPWLVIGKVFG